MFSGFLVAKAFPRRMHGGCHCCHSETVSFDVSLLSCDVLGECSISEGLAIVPLARHRFQTKRGQCNGCLHARLHENVLATEFPENRRAYSSASHRKFDMYYGVNCPLIVLRLCCGQGHCKAASSFKSRGRHYSHPLFDVTDVMWLTIL